MPRVTSTAALPLLEKLHGLAPDAPDLQVALGEALLQAQQVERAIDLLPKAVAADPSMVQAQASLGRALVQAGEFARAVPHLEKALPTDADGSVHYQLAQAMQRTGKPERAKAAARRVSEAIAGGGRARAVTRRRTRRRSRLRFRDHHAPDRHRRPRRLRPP